MLKFLSPYNDFLIPISEFPVQIELPLKADVLVKEGDELGVNSNLATLESAEILEKFSIDSSWKVETFQGELVIPGNVLASKKTDVLRHSVIKSTQKGIIDILKNKSIRIKSNLKNVKLISGFSGKVKNIDNFNLIISAETEGAGIVPIYSYNLPFGASSIINNEKDSLISFFIHEKKKSLDWENILYQKSIVIVDFLMKDDYEFVIKNLSKFNSGLCVITDQRNESAHLIIKKLYDQVKNKRLFIKENLIFSTLWKGLSKSIKYVDLKAGSLIEVNCFNKNSISGKIVSFKGDYALVESSNGKQRYEHYLNILKS